MTNLGQHNGLVLKSTTERVPFLSHFWLTRSSIIIINIIHAFFFVFSYQQRHLSQHIVCHQNRYQFVLGLSRPWLDLISQLWTYWHSRATHTRTASSQNGYALYFVLVLDGLMDLHCQMKAISTFCEHTVPKLKSKYGKCCWNSVL